MPSVVLERDAAQRLFETLIQEGPVMGPREREPGYYVYDWLPSVEELVLDYVTTILPPKKAFFLQREAILHFTRADPPTVEPLLEETPFVLLGVHPCDLAGIAQLDWAFSRTHQDPHYLTRRRQATIIGVDCYPDEYCFCTSVGTRRPTEGFDLFLTPMEAGYYVEIGTAKGQALLDEKAETRPVEPEDLAAAQAWWTEKENRVQRKINTAAYNLPLILQGQRNSPVWTATAAKCYSCGSCNLVCPTCFCFDVQDELDLDLVHGRRVRTWDACQFVDFAKVALGHNFRGNREDRVRHRWYRKFHYLMTAYGRPFCTGCGRCTRACTADIGLVEVLNDLVAETRKEE